MSARIAAITTGLILMSGVPGRQSQASDMPTGTPAVMIMPGGNCAACEVVPRSATKMRSTATKPNFLDKRCPLPPKTVTLCPGACFGYFPTQWRKWEDTCPYPFTTTPIRDSAQLEIPHIPPSSDALPGKNGQIPEPRQFEPKKMKSSIAPLNIPGTRIN